MVAVLKAAVAEVVSTPAAVVADEDGLGDDDGLGVGHGHGPVDHHGVRLGDGVRDRVGDGHLHWHLYTAQHRRHKGCHHKII